MAKERQAASGEDVVKETEGVERAGAISGPREGDRETEGVERAGAVSGGLWGLDLLNFTL